MRHEHAFIISLTLFMGLWGCSGETSDSGANTPSANCDFKGANGTCIGATLDVICSGETCTDSVQCATVHKLAPSDNVASVVSKAAPGDCIALTAGTFSALEIPAGVHVLGVGKASTNVSSLSINGTGPESLVRGLTIKGYGLVVGASAIKVEQVEIVGSNVDQPTWRAAIAIPEGGSLDFVDSTISMSATTGILSTDGASISLTRAVITSTGKEALWTQCTATCDCVSQPVVTLDDVLFSKTSGLVLLGAQTQANHLSVRDTHPSSGSFAGGDVAQGIVVAGCSNFTGSDIEHLGGSGTGFFVSSSNVSLTGGTSDDPTLRLSTHETGGLVIESIDPAKGQGVSVESFVISNCATAGVSASFESNGVHLSHGTISGTRFQSGANTVGDGLAWSNGSALVLDDITISDSARVNLILDGDAGDGSSLTSVTLKGSGKEGNAYVQGTSNLPPGMSDLSPEMHPNDQPLVIWNSAPAPTP
ncbi:MAG: hypothetical protein U0165_15225 [Polyangiaceae bacterium]